MSADPPPPVDPLSLPPLDGRPGPARRIPAVHAARLIDRALAAPPRQASWIRSRRFAIAAGLTLALAGGASATFLASRRPHVAVPNPIFSLEPVPVPMPEPVPMPQPVAEPASEPVPVPVTPPTTVHRVAVPAPDALLAANRLRAQGRWRVAERAYRKIAAGAPRSDAGYAATLAAGSLRLEHLADARGARTLYVAVLRARPDGALAEEARWGLAEAARRLGDRQAEARALRDFIARHPAALERGKAETRLKALEIFPIR